MKFECCRAYVHFSLKPCNKLLFEELPVNLIVVDWAYASFAVLVPFLKLVAVIKVANVTMVDFVDVKVVK